MTAQTATVTWYGAFELKRDYQKHLRYGITFAALFALSVLGAYKTLVTETIAKNEIITVYEPPHPVPPPRTRDRVPLPPIVTNAAPPVPVIGIPTPVPDAEVAESPVFPTKNEIANTGPFSPEGTGTGNNAIVDVPNGNFGDYFPTPDEFMAVEEMPVMISKVSPVYPEVALLTNREATVWIKALIDKEGRVREVRIAKSSGSNVGFDEAALDAAWKNLYKPAIQNGRPVAIWVTYPVEFKLK
ncbi:MAG: periplasmic protein TonB [Parcubacteria group bacterium Gr01-1014_20]|nr:MAG: periplasmic protein TonB [Parcubacteria group bacterium Gr01-1014_20]